MDTVVIVAIAILGLVFFAALTAIILLCRHKRRTRFSSSSFDTAETSPDVHLIGSSSIEKMMNDADLELEEVTMSVTNLETVLKKYQWIDSASNLVQPCIHILKTCHQLTERMVTLAMNNSHHVCPQETYTDIVSMVKKIGPRVDDVVESLYPPLDSRLLEARCAALVLLVSHLVMVTKYVCQQSGELDWIDQSLADVEESLEYMRLVSRAPSIQTDEGNFLNSADFINNAYVHQASSRI